MNESQTPPLSEDGNGSDPVPGGKDRMRPEHKTRGANSMTKPSKPANEERRLAQETVQEQDKWEGVHAELIDISKRKGATSTVHLFYKQFAFRAEKEAIRALLNSPLMFVFKTKSLVEPEQDVGYVEAGRMPFYILAILALIRGTQKSVDIYPGSYNRWTQCVKLAIIGVENAKAVNGILEIATKKHMKTAYDTYHSLFFMSNESGLNNVRGKAIVQWMAALKSEIDNAKEKFALQVLNEEMMEGLTTHADASSISDQRNAPEVEMYVDPDV